MTNTKDNRQFTYLLRVRYAECDAQGVVFNARYADYVDVAVTEYYRAACGGYEKLLEQGLDTQVIHYEITWQTPARFDDVLAIEVSPSKIGNTSFTLGIKFVEQKNDRVVAEATITYVLVNASSYTKMIIPDDLRGLLKCGATGKSINHAGTDQSATR